MLIFERKLCIMSYKIDWHQATEVRVTLSPSLFLLTFLLFSSSWKAGNRRICRLVICPYSTNYLALQILKRENLAYGRPMNISECVDNSTTTTILYQCTLAVHYTIAFTIYCNFMVQNCGVNFFLGYSNVWEDIQSNLRTNTQI